jgi:tRNA U38,U39,U40 pseudouridine synthase TruA
MVKTHAPVACTGCNEIFPSRNQMFKHLKDTNGACLPPEDFENFTKYVKPNSKAIKTALLYGYLPSPPTIQNGEDAAKLLLKTIEDHQGIKEEDMTKINRSYASISRNVDGVAQDDGMGAITEVMAVRLQPIPDGTTVDQWLDQIQAALDQQFDKHTTTTPPTTPIRILGRQDMPHNKFNAEMDVSHRRVEYLLPLSFLRNSSDDFQLICDTIPMFGENHKHSANINKVSGQASKPDDLTRLYLHELKKIMQSLTTRIETLDLNDKAAVMEKEFHLKKRKRRANKKPSKKQKESENDGDDEANSTPTVTDQHKILKRKRFHNFTPRVMAHAYIAYRRLDRIYHRSTLRFPANQQENTAPFLVMSMNGDMFLTGQVLRIMGLFIALANKVIDTDFVDCVFDEEYPHLVPTPPAPLLGMVAGEAYYMTWEGKAKTTLSPRRATQFDRGWNQTSTLNRVSDWSDQIHETTANQWLASGIDAQSGRLNAEKEWTEQVLMPWAETAKKQLEEYRQWLTTRPPKSTTVDAATPSGESDTKMVDAEPQILPSMIPPVETADPTVPEAYEKVLYYLRQADASGNWPSTTLKRQLVMIATEEDAEENNSKSDSLVIAHIKAKNNKEKRSSAYAFVEGQGGASGSFSVGAFPGDASKQPKSNTLFPELTQAAFELEVALCPNREPSSTIAINRNAQFRPHVDSGAGAGQSTSLIVGIGTYSGGELMVEGEKEDIRYKALEFNGWTQRHWTMPFLGERYSLVWFTPKGCEGLRGIDLDLPLNNQANGSSTANQDAEITDKE